MPRPAAASSGDAPGVLAPLRAGEAAPEAAGGVAGADAGSTLGGVAKGFSFGDAKESRSTLSSVTSTVGRSVSQGDALAPPELRRTGGVAGAPPSAAPAAPSWGRAICIRIVEPIGPRSMAATSPCARRAAPRSAAAGHSKRAGRRAVRAGSTLGPFHTKTNRRLDDKRVKTLPGRGRTGRACASGRPSRPLLVARSTSPTCRGVGIGAVQLNHWLTDPRRESGVRLSAAVAAAAAAAMAKTAAGPSGVARGARGARGAAPLEGCRRP